jgi:peptidoglycan/LPS O-acetylase OafA/YrhL
VAHRDDIQGLRAVAVLLVVLGHAGVPFLSGGYVGVDVFFVLSGFLITAILLAEFADRGSISLVGFYLGRARRILPAAALTLVVTDIAAHHLLNFVRAREAVNDSIWSALFAANVHFARQGSDYFAQGQPPSPFLHFWSLSLEEQFYLVWPSLLALLLALRCRRLLLVLVVVGAGSLAWSVLFTAASPAAAYYSTFARTWELALGASLAVAAPHLRRLPARAGFAFGWLGLVSIGCAACSYSERTPFPGSAALMPTVGAALVIGAGLVARQTVVDAGRVLALAPLRYLGDRSYALYLWHWPVLILASQYAGYELSLGAKLALVVFAFLLSVASYRFVENPVRRMRFTLRVSGVLWPASATAVVVVALFILGSIDQTAGRFEAAAAAVHPARLVRTGAPEGPGRWPRSSPRSDRRSAVRRCPCRSPHRPETCAATSTAFPTAARLATGRHRASSVASAQPTARRRSWSSATRTRRCGCRRSCAWQSAMDGPSSRSSSRAASPARGAPRASAAGGTAGPRGEQRPCIPP